MNSNQISKAVKLALMAGAAIAAPSAFAADDQSTTTTTTSNNTSSTNLGKIEVTGTRIKRTDVETAQPVTILTQTQLKQTGLTSIGDILQTVSQAGSALNTIPVSIIDLVTTAARVTDRRNPVLRQRILHLQRILVYVRNRIIHRIGPHVGRSLAR